MTDTELIGKIIELYTQNLPELRNPSWLLTATNDEKNEYIYKFLKNRRKKELRFGYRFGQFIAKFFFVAVIVLVILGLSALAKMLGTYLFF